MDCLTTRESSCGCLTAHTSGHKGKGVATKRHAHVQVCVCSRVHRVPLSEFVSVFGYVWSGQVYVFKGVCRDLPCGPVYVSRGSIT